MAGRSGKTLVTGEQGLARRGPRRSLKQAFTNVTQITFLALNLSYGRSIKTLWTPLCRR
jgi:hypothetical protein